MRLLQYLGSNPARTGRSLAIAAAATAAALMVARSLGAQGIDFSYILTAGRMWMAGADPYGPGFAAAGASVLPAGPIGFSYPPNWWIIAVALAAVPGGRELLTWELLNLAAAAAAGLLFVRSARRLQPHSPEWLPYAFLACLFGCGAMANALRLGQTSIVVLLGLALLIQGLTSDRRVPQVLGLCLLLLKPQVGVLFLLLAMTRPRMRGAAAAALAATVVACLPTLFSFGVEGTLASAANFLRNLGAYGKLPWNWPTYMPGMPFLFAAAGARVSPVVAIAVAWLAAEAALRRRRYDPDPLGWVADFWLIAVGAVTAIVPLHLYDFVLCVPCLLLLPSLRDRTSASLMLFCVVLVWSANDIARALYLMLGGSTDAFWTATRLEAGLLTAAGISLFAVALRRRARADAMDDDAHFAAGGGGLAAAPALEPFLAADGKASASR